MKEEKTNFALCYSWFSLMRLIASASIITLILLAHSPKAGAESVADSLLFAENHVMEDSAKGELRLNIDNICFFRDNEYEGNLAKGYTLPGFWIRPTVGYQPLKNLKVEIGAYMLHYWGASKYPNLNYSDMPKWKGSQTQRGFHVLPFLRAQVALSDKVNLVVGSIYGHGNHRLIEPLYTQELGLQGDPEAGVQLLLDLKRLDLDMWINWESFIYDGDDHQESFTYGLSARVKANGETKRFHVYFPVQLLFQHRGGEINDEAEDREVRTWINGAIGGGMLINVGDQVLKDLNFEVLGAFYSQRSGTLLPFDDGYGIYAKGDINLWRFNIGAGWWWCKDFVSIHGNPLFGCMSISEDGFVVDKTRLIKLHADYCQPIAKGFSLGISADAWNSLPADAHDSEGFLIRQSNALSLSFGVYLRINPSFLLKKFGR